MYSYVATYQLHMYVATGKFFVLYINATVISEPDDVTMCEGEGAVFTCVLNSNIRSDDVQWYKDSVMVDPNGESINFLNRTNGSTTSSLLTITNARRSYAGDFWVRISSRTVCRVSLIILPSMYLCSYVAMFICM